MGKGNNKEMKKFISEENLGNPISSWYKPETNIYGVINEKIAIYKSIISYYLRGYDCFID